jgi:hypothetical protein
VSEFEKIMDELKKFNNEAQLWLSKIPPKHWSRSHFTGNFDCIIMSCLRSIVMNVYVIFKICPFTGRAHSDVLLNNTCEVMNAKIIDGRDKPIITVLEYIREYLMRRIVNVLKVIDRCDGLLTPTAARMFDCIKKEATKYSVIWNGEEHYQVSAPGGDQCVLDMSRMTCVCRRWVITGIPCKHAVAAIWNKAANGQQVGVRESFVLPVCRLDRWKEVYNYKVYPINGRALWQKSQVPTVITQPNHHKPVGRPKKARKRSAVELEESVTGGRLSKKETTYAYAKCKKKGHKSRSCKGQEQV